MEFGIQFFPDVTPDQKPAEEYFDESLRLAGLCDETGFTHVRTVEHYFESYGGYGKIIAKLDHETFETQVASGGAWVGTPDELIERIESYQREIGGFEIASLQVNFNLIRFDDAARSMRLFGDKVIPRFADREAAAE